MSSRWTETFTQPLKGHWRLTVTCRLLRASQRHLWACWLTVLPASRFATWSVRTFLRSCRRSCFLNLCPSSGQREAATFAILTSQIRMQNTEGTQSSDFHKPGSHFSMWYTPLAFNSLDRRDLQGAHGQLKQELKVSSLGCTDEVGKPTTKCLLLSSSGVSSQLPEASLSPFTVLQAKSLVCSFSLMIPQEPSQQSASHPPCSGDQRGGSFSPFLTDILGTHESLSLGTHKGTNPAGVCHRQPLLQSMPLQRDWVAVLNCPRYANCHGFTRHSAKDTVQKTARID